MKNLAKAVVEVMKAVKSIDKNSQVGSGNYGYKGTRDQDVKEAFNTAMSNNGLCMIPQDIDEETFIDRWEENGRSKQSVFTKVTVKYLLLHESGESTVLCGYGHGVDSQDKGAGKATTYAMKYALLYTFMTPVGTIDDADNTHSQEIKDVPKAKTQFTPAHAKWDGAKKAIAAGTYTVDELKKTFIISKANEKLLLS